MRTQGQRMFIYAALAIVCSALSVFLGLAAVAWSFLHIVAVIELMYRIGTPGGSHLARSW